MRNGIDYVIKVFTNQHPDFYRVMGPFLSRREIVAETGFPTWDDDSKTWLVASSGSEVLGFCSYDTRSNGSLIRMGSDYVLPQYRRLGIYRALFEEREHLTSGSSKRAVATHYSGAAFARSGYVEVKKFKRYSVFEKR